MAKKVLSNRFSIRRELGSGGMGVVYEAYDEKRRQVVALKTMHRADASALYRFKKEFRTVSGLSHPNLVGLYELLIEEDEWFFTMEFIQGSNFREYVCPGSLNQSRLISALRQMVEGVFALHRAGIIHRDLKPPNVLVTEDGRLVILDLGLAADLTQLSTTQTLSGQIAGTIAYMAPEQAAGAPATEAADWYSVGVMLYEVLTGGLPFCGNMLEILQAKQSREPSWPPSETIVAPPSLIQLARDLLQLNPDKRPNGVSILTTLNELVPASEASAQATAPRYSARFLGRKDYLAVLRRALEQSRRGDSIAVYVYGRSGTGKTALIQHFLDSLRESTGVVTLTGRCYDRESVPYKAFDGIIDNLAKYLRVFSRTEAEALLPRDVYALARLFPVLNQVDAIRTAPRRDLDMQDPFALRRRAFAALREVFQRVSDKVSLVIYIDDLQWADADSTLLLDDLLKMPDAPRLLLLSSFRIEDTSSNPFLQRLTQGGPADRSIRLQIDRLSESEGFEMAEALLGPRAKQRAEDVRTIARESGGNPFFLEQMAQYLLENERAAGDPVGLEEVLLSRIRRMPEGASDLLNVIAVAGHPISPEVAFEVAGSVGNLPRLISTLRSGHLIRGSSNDDRIEMYHDRIRETLAGLIDPERSQVVHAALARALETAGEEPEKLFEHLLRAGDHAKAARQATLVAKRAESALAFDKAALFYRRALEGSFTSSSRQELETGLAEVLANAGRPADAAHLYLKIAADLRPAQALEHQTRAAAQLLMGGHIDEGISVIRTVLSSLRLKLAGGPRRALLSLLIRRVCLKLRGLDFEPKTSADIPDRDLLLIDTCWSVAIGLAMVDNIRAADFQTRNLLLSLRAGEPYRIARAFAAEAGFSATIGGSGRRRTEHFLRSAEVLARKLDNPHALGLTNMMAGAAAFLFGRWKEAAELSMTAEEILRDRCSGVTWELTSAQNFVLGSYLYLGEFRKLLARRPPLLAAAQERGNLYAEIELRTRMNIVWLCDDDPDAARKEVHEAMSRWSPEGFYRQHYNATLAECQAELYGGNAAAAWDLINARWDAIRKALLLRIQVLRIEALHLRARCAIAVAEKKRDVKLLAFAERAAHRIGRERMPWSSPLAQALHASVLNLRGEHEQAVEFLKTAEEGFRLSNMAAYAAAAKRSIGIVVGGETGKTHVAEADGWMLNERIRQPEHMASMLVPGF